MAVISQGNFRVNKHTTHTQTHTSKRTTKHIENSVLKIMKYDKKQNNKIYIK